MLIIAVSDLHGNLPPIPPCDVLIVAGDICPIFDEDLTFQLGWLDTNFRNWLNEVPAKRIVGIAGNHDFVFERWSSSVRALNLPWRYLQDSSMKYKGVWFYGIPWVPKLRNWAFYATDEELEQKFAAIPERTDIIISHGPPKGFVDETLGYWDFADGKMWPGNSAGSVAALKAIHRVKPAAFICGHIHEAAGVVHHQSTQTLIMNVSYVDVDYKAQFRVSVLRLFDDDAPL